MPPGAGQTPSPAVAIGVGHHLRHAEVYALGVSRGLPGLHFYGLMDKFITL
jgi:hypothetical protein